MLRAKLPWLFMALAVASPLLLFVLFWGLIRNETDQTDPDGTAFIVAAIGWVFSSVVYAVAFVTLATMAWKPTAQLTSALRRLALILFGSASIPVGFGIFVFGVNNGDYLARLAIGATGLMLFSVGFLALWQAVSTARRNDNGAGDG